MSENIIAMAREAGFRTGTLDSAHGKDARPFAMQAGAFSCLHELERFAALVRADAQMAFEKRLEAICCDHCSANMWARGHA